jgi:hypothetical protein
MSNADYFELIINANIEEKIARVANKESKFL